MVRDNYISTAKAIGIILMVVGHAISQNFCYRFIYMFHMPLFFFCSGYFYKVPKSMEEVRCFALKRIKGLYLPYLKWSLLFLLLHNTFCSWNLYGAYVPYYDSLEYLRRLRSLFFTMTGHEPLICSFWFFKELLLASILVCVVTFIYRKVKCKYKDIFGGLVLIVMTIVSKPGEWGIPIIWNVSLLSLSASFVFAGYMYRKVEIESFYTFRGLLLSVIIVLAVVWLWNDFLDMLWYGAGSVILYIPIALVGIYMVLCVSKLIDRYTIKKLFYYIGKHTLIIFVLHMSVFKIVNLMKIWVYELSEEKLADSFVIHEHNEFFWFFYAILGIGIPLLLQESWRRLKGFCLKKTKA